MARSLCGVPGLINDGSAHSRTGSETTEDQRSKNFSRNNLAKWTHVEITRSQPQAVTLCVLDASDLAASPADP